MRWCPHANKSKKRATLRREKLLRLLAIVAACALVPGLFLDSFTLSTSIGNSLGDAMLKTLIPATMGDRSLSLVDSAMTLLDRGNPELGVLVLAFAILFPVAKLLLVFLLLIVKPGRLFTKSR